jgi:asparagine synthase (glutamine-hydrolysing)
LAHLDPTTSNIPCYTFAGADRDTLDVRVARKVAFACRQPYQVLRLGKDFFANFMTLAEHVVFVSDGCHDVFGTHDLYFNRLARQIAPVRMTGKFGSEVIRDRSGLEVHPIPGHLLDNAMRDEVDSARARLATLQKQYDQLSFAVLIESAYREHGKSTVEQSQTVVQTPYLDLDLIRLMYRAPEGVRSSASIQWRLIAAANRTLAGIPTNRGDCPSTPLSLSIFRRLAYRGLLALDYRYYGRLPHRFLSLDSLIRRSGLESLLFGHQKFEHYRLWLREELAEHVKFLLLDRAPSVTAFFKDTALKLAVTEHLAGTHNHARLLNKALTLEMVMRRFGISQ